VTEHGHFCEVSGIVGCDVGGVVKERNVMLEFSGGLVGMAWINHGEKQR
jgi:hypothetical protein